MRQVEKIADRIHAIRGRRVLPGADLALLDEVPDKALTQLPEAPERRRIGFL